MSCRLLILPFGIFLLVGCLQEGPLPTGRHLFAGQNVESPGFINVAGESMIRFEERKSFATVSQSGVTDLWISSFDGSRQRKVVVNRSDRLPWAEQGPDSAGARYFMVDESRIVGGRSTVPIASLVRLGPTLEEETRIEGIATYVRFEVSPQVLHDQPQPGQTCPGAPSLQKNCPQLFYERPPATGQTYPTLFLWDGVNHLPIGADSGSFQVQTAGSGASYFILGDKQALMRLNRPSNTLEFLRDKVSRFAVSGDERYAALTVSEDNKTKTVVRDLTTGTEIALARPNPSSWGVSARGGVFGTKTFNYMQNATASAPAELHALDLETGEDKATLLPSPLTNLAGTLERPKSDEWLLFDSQGHGVFAAKNDDFVARRALAAATTINSPKFTEDGNFLLYIVPVLPTLYDLSVRGALMIQDVALTQAARTVSPSGLQVPPGGYFFTPGTSGPILVFWANLGRANSDLFFADTQTGDVRLVAKAIQSVLISAHNLFGILNASQQDGVGDLVYRDLDLNADTVLAHAVADATLFPGTDLSTSWTAYIVRGRAPSDRAGLWLTTLASPASPDGGTD